MSYYASISRARFLGPEGTQRWDRQDIYWDIYSDWLENADLIKGKAGGNSLINIKMEWIGRSLTKGSHPDPS